MPDTFFYTALKKNKIIIQLMFNDVHLILQCECSEQIVNKTVLVILSDNY